MQSENVYDFTIFKIENMIHDLIYAYGGTDHPDIYPLRLLLKMYINGDVDIYWDGGYPMVGNVNF